MERLPLEQVPDDDTRTVLQRWAYGDFLADSYHFVCRFRLHRWSCRGDFHKIRLRGTPEEGPAGSGKGWRDQVSQRLDIGGLRPVLD
jgi:hypothetical protein